MAQRGKVPVTMLSGFLGAGKTTLLKYVLENDKGMRVACVVNDVASVNIDAKLVRNANRAGGSQQVEGPKSLMADMVELQNGCACCSAADELFPAFEQILTLAAKRGEPFDRIILENSGVAEPQNIRDSFTDAALMNHPLLDRIELSNLITVVDSATFIRDFSSRVPLAMRSDLGEGGTMRPVVDLLVEQIECADVVVLNKADLLNQQTIEGLPKIITSLNSLAKVVTCSNGKMPLDIFKMPGIISNLNVESQHRNAVQAAKESEEKASGGTHGHKEQHEHGHKEQHEHGHKEQHEHGHKEQHEHGHKEQHEHGHKEQHEHGHHQNGDHGHDHHHGHGHDHHHHHDHENRQQTTAAKRFGITSFVYQRRKPFHPARLRDLVLKWLPAPHNSAIEGATPAVGDRPIKKVLRSKGFAWLSNNHCTAFYWSHAGQHFELREEGDWWAAVEAESWPVDPDMRDVVLSDFEGSQGDRRQEIVFIGADMDEDGILAQLDEALLTDEEYRFYVDSWSKYPDPPVPQRTSS